MLRCFLFALLGLVVVIVFFLTEALLGDACTAYLGRYTTPERLEGYREARGLNCRAWDRFGEWLGGILCGNLGISMTLG